MRFRVFAIFLFWLVFTGGLAAQTPRPSMTVLQRSGSFLLRAKHTKEQKRRLLPDLRDIQKYEKFLRKPRTGIFRLMPDLGCSENLNVVKADQTCLNFIPESSFYSFREKEHTIGILSDIRLKNGFLISDGILSQGILVNLGEIELEKVLLEGEGMDFLANFLPNPLSVEAHRQFLQLEKGIKIGKYEYRRFLPAVENSIYALRVIAYRGELFRVVGGFRFDLLDGDKRIDLTLAFQVVRKEKDGGVTLLWKELRRQESPRIVFPKKKDK